MNLNVLIANAALAVRADGTYAPFSAEAWKYAGEMTLLGVGMIFAVLGVLWGVLAIFKLIFAGRSEAPKADPAPKTESKPAPAPAPKAVPVADANADAALIAVLTAAVAAYRSEEEGATGEFRVVSFKRASAGRAWNGRK